MPVKVLTRDECEALGKRVLGKVSAPLAEVRIGNSVSASNTYARGDLFMAAENDHMYVSLTAGSGSDVAESSTNNVDDASLDALVAEVATLARQRRGPPAPLELLGPQQYLTPPKLRFDTVTDLMAPPVRADVCRQAIEAAERAGLSSTGNIYLEILSRAMINSAGMFGHSCETRVDFEVSARTKDGTGAGWAWGGAADWARIDAEATVARAIDLARRSANPSAVEPGRYTVILEPAAVADFLYGLVGQAREADAGYGVFANQPRGTNKIGLKMIDERLSVVSDLWDPERPLDTFGLYGEPLRNVTWFERGVLKELTYDRRYAESKGRKPTYYPGGHKLMGHGPTQTLEEMIASTKRGIWVNHCTYLQRLNEQTALMTGATRDGTFLIENGKITRPIKNLRFTESIFFMLNRLEAFGDPVRASLTMVAPRLKIRDFDFTSLTDAI